MNDYYLYTDQMSVGYNGKTLIHEVEIRLKKGQILTLIGPNGAGKSTILKSISRQLKLTGGVVYLDGKAMQGMSGKEIAKKMALVMTERIRPELMTCEDVVATGRYPYTGRLGLLTPNDEKKVQEAMEMVHALEFKDQDFVTVSDGQRQRILLARAICQEPEVILLDEPTSFLDIKHKLELLTILKNMVTQKQTAVLMSLHELDLAQRISDQVICVKGDSIQKYGTPEKIFSSDYICELYEITKGSYHAAFGSLEMEKQTGEPEVFVIAGNRSGISVFRHLWREGIPFAAGILHENDCDYEVAKALAVEVAVEKAFEPIQETTYERAVQLMKRCRKVICCLDTFGTLNRKNQELLELAKELQLEISGS